MPLPVPQAQKAEDIKKEIETFSAKVRHYKMDFGKRSYYKFGTGYNNAYSELDAVSREVAEIQKECVRLVELAAVFEFPQLVDPVKTSLKEIAEDMVAVKDVWDTVMLCELQFQDWRQTLWNDIKTEVMEDGAKAFVKEVKSLSKKIRDEDCFKGLDAMVKNFLVSVPLVADLRSPAMRERHWEQLMSTTKVTFDVKDPKFSLNDLLALELHKFEEEVG